MSAVAVLLLALGVADLVGGQLRQGGRSQRWWPAAAGVATSAAAGLLSGWSSWADVLLLLLVAAVVVCWEASAARALGTNSRHWLPLLVLAGGGVVLVLLSGYAAPVAGPFGDWLRWSGLPGLSTVAADRALLVAGLLAVQVSTANVVVRLVLRHVGALRPTGPQPSDRLRGGRLLGPMERVVILGLGLAGEVTAASLVIAAKGLIRWPELQKSKAAPTHEPFPGQPEEVTIDEVTEYFLVGSMVSWLIALAAVGVARLG